MPNIRIRDSWKELIRGVKANNPRYGPNRIREELERLRPGAEYPSPRTIGRVLESFQDLPRELRDQYLRFYWPEAMENGLLPWESSAASLELRRHADAIGADRPTIRCVRWFWRVTQIIPDATLQERREIAAYVGVASALRGSREDAIGVLRDCEWRLEHWGEKAPAPKTTTLAFNPDDTEAWELFQEFFWGIRMGRFI